MTDNLPEVWTTRDYPVLLEITRRKDHGAASVNATDVATDLGVDPKQVRLAMAALLRRGYVLDPMHTAEDTSPIAVCEVSGSAYLITGLHPDGDDAINQLVAAIRQAAELIDDDDEKSRLKVAADSLLGVGRGVLGGVLTAWLTAQSTG